VPKVGIPFAAALEVLSIAKHVANRARGADVLLGTWAYPEGVSAVALGRLLNIPVVVKVHGSDLNVIASLRGVQNQVRSILPHAARVIAVSRSLADKAGELGVDNRRLRVVPNGVDRSLFHLRDCRAARDLVGWSQHRAMILYCGRIEKSKGVFELIEAFRSLLACTREAHLVFLGDGSARAQAEIAARNIRTHVHFIGMKPLEAVPVWMAASSLVVLPSHAEGSPNVVREAMACGRPVVATRVGGIAELMIEGKTGAMVEPKSSSALAGAMLHVLRSSFEPRVIASSAPGTWESSASALHEVLAEATEVYS